MVDHQHKADNADEDVAHPDEHLVARLQTDAKEHAAGRAEREEEGAAVRANARHLLALRR